MKEKVVVIGQGYVGLPLAIAIAEAGYLVAGIDIDIEKVNSINKGISMIEDVNNETLQKQLQLGKYSAHTDFNKVSESQIVVICVPTPLDLMGNPDMSFLMKSVSDISKCLKPNTLVILESTVSPGTTREILFPSLFAHSELTVGEIDIAFSPERVDPGNKFWNMVKTPKIVSGLTKKAHSRAVEFYSGFIDTVVECDSIEIAEMAKLLENSFRLINISFINELSIFCNKLGVDINKVIEAASTKPYGFMPFYPSLGVGGHCIPVDPVYLLDKSRNLKTPLKMINLAIDVNKYMPIFYIQRAKTLLGKLKNKRILVLGVSYKSNISDFRETPVQALIAGLRSQKAHVFWHDELVKDWNGEKSVALSSDFDLAILATPHDSLDLTKLGNVPILNTRGSI